MSYVPSSVVVPPFGPRPSRVLLVGERPGESEARHRRPFVGRAGKEQDRYLAAAGGVTTAGWRLTNVALDFVEGNPPPTPEAIDYWASALDNEVKLTAPSFIITAGVYATRAFLGPDATMELCHGIPHRSDRAPGSVILPVTHPAAGFYDDEARTQILYDYQRAVGAIRGTVSVAPPTDEYEGREIYRDVTGMRLAYTLNACVSDAIAIDTEGVPGDEWSIQVSLAHGTGLTLRCSQPDFATGIAAIERYCRRPGVVVVVHNAMYDLEMCLGMGLNLYDPTIRLFDTRYAAYVLRVEPQGLKALCYRWCGMRQPDYADVVGAAGIEKQLDYLGRVIELTADWPKPEPRAENENDGTTRVYTPQPISRRAEAIILDYHSGKLDKDGNRTDPLARWHKCDPVLRRQVERELGRMPVGTLADIPLPDAIQYASRDPDATLRLYHRMVPVLKGQGLLNLAHRGNYVLPVFSAMQTEGVLVRRDYCVRKAAEMTAYMNRRAAYISTKYYSGAPFNPNSSNMTATVMRRRGLEGEKRTKTGKVSTAKKSIEHLRYEDDAMEAIIDWREHQKMRDAYYEPFIYRIDETVGPDATVGRIRCSLNPYKVISRRLAASDPNLLGIPVRNDLGIEVRDGVVAGDGYILASWDLSAAEMRYMAHLSGDALLISMFLEGRDPHSETAARIFHIPLDKVDKKKHRYPAKRAGFGIITNIQGPGLLDQLRMFGCEGWTEAKCDQLIEDWLTVYPGVAKFLDDCRMRVRRDGLVRDEWGMVRYLPGVWSDDRKVAAEAERAGSSMLIQGGAQGMLQNSIAWLRPYLWELRLAGVDIRWVIQIHDSLMIRMPRDAWDMVNPLVVEALTQHHGVVNIKVPMEAEGSYADTWGAIK